MTEVQALRDRLEALAGANTALFAVLGVLLMRHHGDPAVIAALEDALENGKASMLQAPVSERQLEAFDATALAVRAIL